jgi:septal ring factor EnvC (AmiA/AmiB activator)
MRILVLTAVLLAVPGGLAAQRRNIERQIRQQQSRLDSITQEREALEDQLRRLRSRARDIDTEISNLNRQVTSTGRIVNELDRQLGTLNSQLDTLTLELILVEDALAEKKAVLERRIVAIHKRGPLWAFQVLLAAESFGDLLSRYKYLHAASRQDRSLVQGITTLRNQISASRRDLITVQDQVEVQRTERGRELERYARLERERQRALASTRQREQLAAARITALEADAQRLNDLIASLVRARGTVTLPAATMSEDDLGRLDWPVEGELVYHFGQQPFRDGTSINREGIGIRTPENTPVRAVRTGIVAEARPYGTWGNIVILNHGGGYWTVYTQLSEIRVAEGDIVQEGEALGLSGGANTAEGPHLGFQIRLFPPDSPGNVPLDPLNWLRHR